MYGLRGVCEIVLGCAFFPFCFIQEFRFVLAELFQSQMRIRKNE